MSRPPDRSGTEELVESEPVGEVGITLHRNETTFIGGKDKWVHVESRLPVDPRG
jgi:hypothetical protein